MNRLLPVAPTLAALALVAGVALGGMLHKDGEKHDEDERVEELMERIHEGRRSPYRKVGAEAARGNPAWDVVAAALPRFDEMSRALLESKDDAIQGSADGYVDAVKALRDAAGKRDAAGFRTAFDALTQSCGDCHFDGGVGGELDEDD